MKKGKKTIFWFRKPPADLSTLKKKKTLNSLKGSALTAVIILSGLVVIIVASIIALSIREKALLDRNQSHQEAKLAAESMGEWVTAKIVADFTSTNGSGTLNPNVTLPDRFVDFFDQTFSNVIRASFEDQNRMGIYVSPQYDLTLDSDNVFYKSDTDATEDGLTVKAQDILCYTHVTTISGSEESDFYIEQFYQVRLKPLNTGLVFYNKDLRVMAGTDFKGDVHVNGSLKVRATQKDTTFDGNLTLSGGLSHPGANRGFTAGGKRQWNGNVFFKSSVTGGLESMWLGRSGILANDGSTGYPEGEARAAEFGAPAVEESALGEIDNPNNWLTSDHPQWDSLSVEKWGSNLQTQLPKLNPIAIKNYEDRDDKKARNYAYSIIEPLLDSSHPGRKSNAIRSQKIASKAGITFKINEDGTIKAYVYPQTNNTNDTTQAPVEINIPPKIIGKTDSNLTTVTSTEVEQYQYNSSANRVTSGMYDRNQLREDGHDYNQGVSLVTFDVSEFRKYIDNTAKHSDWGGNFDFNEHWSNKGVVYFEFPVVDDIEDFRKKQTDESGNVILNVDGNEITGDLATRAKASDSEISMANTRRMALQIINAEVLPQDDPNRGVTFATNGPIYLKGHFNADGQHSTGTGNNLVKGSDYTSGSIKEVPAALVADSITFLSDAWDSDSRGLSHLKMEKWGSGDGKAAWDNRGGNSIEVSAAILTGAPGGDADRSIDKLFNFLENPFNSKTGYPQVYIRGSLVRLFDSEVYKSKVVYSDLRDKGGSYGQIWEQNPLFKEGKNPPGLPQVVNYRRIRQRFITENEFNSAINEIEKNTDPRKVLNPNADSTILPLNDIGIGAKPLGTQPPTGQSN